MKTSSMTLDRVLYRILMEEDLDSFTVMELRDLYIRFVDPHEVTLPQIRVYIYDQIRRMIELGWAAYHPERKKRGQRFLINEIPVHLQLKLIAPRMGMAERHITEEAPKEVSERLAIEPDPAASRAESKPDRSPALTVQKMLKEVYLDFQTALGATERYKLLIDEMPDLKSTLEPELVAARDNSSRLLGHMNALKATLQKLGAV